jgi:hypothetical protein
MERDRLAALLDRAASLLAASSMHAQGEATIEELRSTAKELRGRPQPRSAAEAAYQGFLR